MTLQSKRLVGSIPTMLLAIVLAGGSVAMAWAQGQGQTREGTESEGASGPRHKTGGAQAGQQGANDQDQGYVAQVGAGTTNGTTTGYSGPQSKASKKPGENATPPLPSDKLCKSYEGTAIHEQCLDRVLRR